MNAEAADGDTSAVTFWARNRPQLLVSGLTIAVALVAVAVSVVHRAPALTNGEFDIPNWAFVIFFYGAEMTVLHFRLRRDTHSFSMSEFPLVLGLFLLAPIELVVAHVFGSGLALVFHRRQPLIKLCFNLAQLGLQVVLATVVFHAIIDPADPLAVRGWLAVIIAVTLTYLLSSTLITAAIKLSGGTIRSSERLTVLGLSGVAGLLNAALGIAAVTIIISRPQSAGVAIIPPLVLYFAYRAYIRQKVESHRLESLYAASQELHRLPEIEDAAAAAVARARAMFDVERVELTIYPDGPLEPGFITTATSDGEVDVMATTGAATPESLVMEIFATRAPVLIHRDRRRSRSRLTSDAIGMAAPIAGTRDSFGVLKVHAPVGDVSNFDGTDLRLLETLAGNISVSMENARLGSSLAKLTVLKDQLHHQALHDALTGLANRAMLEERLQSFSEGNSVDHAALLYLDLDDFKTVNDTFGHDVGDRLLIHVATVLERSCRPHDTVARIGGDEFIILLEHLPTEAHAQIVADRIGAQLSDPVSINGELIAPRVSIGIAPFDRSLPANTVVQAADAAMYAAKQEGNGGSRMYTSDLLDAEERGALTRHDIERALDHDEFTLHYQPIVDPSSFRVQSLEALIRWEHPVRGFVSPGEFIPIAERVGLIHEVGRWVLSRACAEVKALCEELDMEMPVLSVNLSASEVGQPDLMQMVMEALTASDVAADRLQLEITETAMIAEDVSQLEALRQFGVKIALDDFGTGYSSLSYLDVLPLDTVKIDRSFVDRIEDKKAETLIRMIIAISHEMGFSTVAEGIETNTQLETVQRLGCDAVQGFLIARPMPQRQIAEYISSTRLLAAASD